MKFTTRKHLGMYAIAVFAVAMTFTLSAPDTTEFPSPGSPMGSETEKTTMQETISSLKIDNVKMPTYLPGDLVFEKSNVAQDGLSANIEFSNESMKLEYYLQQTSFDPIKAVDTPTNNIVVTVEQDGEFVSSTEYPPTIPSFERLTVNGADAIYVEGDDKSSPKIVWYTNGIFYHLSGEFSEKELFRVANSIQ